MLLSKEQRYLCTAGGRGGVRRVEGSVAWTWVHALACFPYSAKSFLSQNLMSASSPFLSLQVFLAGVRP